MRKSSNVNMNEFITQCDKDCKKKNKIETR